MSWPPCLLAYNNVAAMLNSIDAIYESWTGSLNLINKISGQHVGSLDSDKSLGCSLSNVMFVVWMDTWTFGCCKFGLDWACFCLSNFYFLRLGWLKNHYWNIQKFTYVDLYFVLHLAIQTLFQDVTILNMMNMLTSS